jgi:hypothetical protein
VATEAKVVLTAEDRVSQVIRQVQGSLAGLSSSIGNLGAGLGITAIVGGLRAIIGALDDLSEVSQGVGVTARQLAELRLAASESGVSAEKLDAALGQLNVKIADAAAGNRQAVRLFKDLGVAFADSAGNARATIDVLRDISAVFSTSADGAGKTALAMEALGKSGRILVPYLNQGADALQKFAGVTDDSVREASKLQGEIDKLTASFKNLLLVVGGQVAGGINRLFDSGSVQDRIAEVETIIRSMEQAQIGDPKNLQRYRDELAKLKAELKDENLQRFLGGGNALRRAEQGGGLRKSRDEEERTGAARERKVELGVSAAGEGRAGEVEARLRLLEDAAKTAARLDELLGRDKTQKLQQDLNLLNEAFFRGAIGVNEYDEAVGRLLGSNLPQEVEQTKEAFTELGLVFESAVSRLFTDGDLNARNFFKALGDDIAQTITKILIMEPLLKRLRELLSSGSGGQGIGGLFSGLLGLLQGRALGGPVFAGSPYVVGERGPELFVPSVSGQIVPNGVGMGGVTIVQNNSIDARSDIATIRAMLENNKAATVREVGNQLARRGALARV